MRLITRAAIIFISMLIILIIFIVFQFIKKNDVKYLRASLESMGIIMIQNQLDLISSPVSQYLQDISLWDETVRFMKTRNRVYSYENINLSGTLYNINETWIYTPGFNKIYHFRNSSASSAAGDLNPILPEINNRFKSEKFFSFFYAKNKTIYKILCSSIHPSTDTERKTEPAGYIITSILYNKELFNALKKKLPALQKVEISADFTKHSKNHDLLSVNIPLQDINGNTSGLVHAEFELVYLRTIQKLGTIQRYFLFLTIFFLIITAFFFFNGVIRPVRAIYKILFQSDYTPNPSFIKKIPYEFERIMGLINLNRTFEIKLYKALKDAEKQKALAEKATQEKSEFLASMSHEIRTPMTGVLGFSDMLLETPLNNEQLEIADGIKKSARSTLAIINGILDLSKIEAGKLILADEPFDINKLLEDVRLIIKGLSTGKKMDIVLDNSHENKITFQDDKQRLRQILLNLCGNAIKYTLEGEVRINASSVQLSDDLMEFTFSVRDTGVGMTEDQLDRIFENYEQVYDPDAFTGGTGLGLAITKNLTELMNGSLNVSSTPGEGSTFTVKIKMKFNRNKLAESEYTMMEDLGLNILVAEDNLISMRIIKNILTKAGCACDPGFTGQQAVEAADSKKYDLILMDFQMPVLDGTDASKIIRAGTGPNRNTPIYAISADLPEYSAVKSAESGMNGFITKPFNNREINAILTHVKKAKTNNRQP